MTNNPQVPSVKDQNNATDRELLAGQLLKIAVERLYPLNFKDTSLLLGDDVRSAVTIGEWFDKLTTAAQIAAGRIYPKPVEDKE